MPGVWMGEWRGLDEENLLCFKIFLKNFKNIYK